MIMKYKLPILLLIIILCKNIFCMENDTSQNIDTKKNNFYFHKLPRELQRLILEKYIENQIPEILFINYEIGKFFEYHTSKLIQYDDDYIDDKKAERNGFFGNPKTSFNYSPINRYKAAITSYHFKVYTYKICKNKFYKSYKIIEQTSKELTEILLDIIKNKIKICKFKDSYSIQDPNDESKRIHKFKFSTPTKNYKKISILHLATLFEAWPWIKDYLNKQKNILSSQGYYDLINEKDELGLTPLNLATSLNDKTFKILLEAGADVTIKDIFENNVFKLLIMTPILENLLNESIDWHEITLDINKLSFNKINNLIKKDIASLNDENFNLEKFLVDYYKYPEEISRKISKYKNYKKCDKTINIGLVIIVPITLGLVIIKLYYYK